MVARSKFALAVIASASIGWFLLPSVLLAVLAAVVIQKRDVAHA